MPLYTIRGYAKHRGVSHPAVLKAIDTGRIPVRKDGRIDSELADRAWTLNTNLTKPRNSITGNPKGRLDGARGLPAGLGSGGTVGPEEERIVSGWAAARSLREAFAAKREKIAYEREAGLYVPVAEVHARLFEAGRKVRDALRQLPSRVAPMMIGLEQVDDAHRILQTEVDRALSELERLRPAIDELAAAAAARTGKGRRK